jgi:hypothetical protein
MTPTSPRTSRAHRASVAVCLLAAVVAGCGSSGHQPAKRHVAPPGPPHGLAVLTCPGQGAPTIRVIDPLSGHTTRTIRTADDVTGPGGQLTTTAQCPSGADPTDGVQVLHTRQQFAPDFARQAATTGQLRDGTTHVGYVNLQTHRFTDISAASADTGFSDQAGDATDPLFSSDGTRLLFVRDQRNLNVPPVKKMRQVGAFGVWRWAAGSGGGSPRQAARGAWLSAPGGGGGGGLTRSPAAPLGGGQVRRSPDRS